MRFYLATDCPQTDRALRDRFGARLLVQGECVRARDTLEGMHAALADLLSLARCQRLLGSFYSSFSVMAALLGDGGIHRLRIVGDEGSVPASTEARTSSSRAL